MNPNMWSSILAVKNVMAQAPNTPSLPRPREKSSIPENLLMNEAWRCAANALLEGLVFQMGPLNTHGMTRTTNLINWESPYPTITNLNPESGETRKPILNP